MTQTKKSTPTILLWALAIAWVGVLFYLSGQNAQQSSELSGWFTSLVLRVLAIFDYAPANLEPILRKIAHFAIFAVEGFLLGLAVLHTWKRRRWPIPAALAVCAVMAAANEYHQSFVDGRSCELRDMCIDFSGSLLGMLAALALIAIVRAVRRRRNVII